MVLYMYLCSFGTWEMTTFWGGGGRGEGEVKRDLLFQNCPWTGLFDQRQQNCLNLGKTYFLRRKLCRSHNPSPQTPCLCRMKCKKIWIQKAYPMKTTTMIVHKHTCLPSGHKKGENRNTRGSGKSRPCLMQNRIPLHGSNFLATKTVTKIIF